MSCEECLGHIFKFPKLVFERVGVYHDKAHYFMNSRHKLSLPNSLSPFFNHFFYLPVSFCLEYQCVYVCVGIFVSFLFAVLGCECALSVVEVCGCVCVCAWVRACVSVYVCMRMGVCVCVCVCDCIVLIPPPLFSSNQHWKTTFNICIWRMCGCARFSSIDIPVSKFYFGRNKNILGFCFPLGLTFLSHLS